MNDEEAKVKWQTSTGPRERWQVVPWQGENIMTDDLTRYLTVQGYPMTDSTKIIAALVIRLGGEAHLTDVEYREAQGLCVWKNPEGGMTLAANTAASLGSNVLNDSTVE